MIRKPFSMSSVCAGSAAAVLLSALLAAAPGCRVNRGDRVTAVGVPAGAVMAKEGTGELEFEPDRDGEVFVIDADREALVYEGRIDDDDRLTVDPGDDEIEVNGRTVFDRELDNDHKHRIYFRGDRRD